MNWLCWHVGTVTDPKIGRVADACQTARVNVLGVWAVILEKAKEGRGLYTFDADDAAYALGIDAGLVAAIHAELEAKGLVSCGEVVNWLKRQHGTSAVRMARKRAEQNEQAEHVTHSDAHAVNARTVTPTDRQTDTQTDRQTKKERDSQGESLSARASRLPEDWAPEPETEIPDDVVTRERPRFADYWRAQPGAKGRKLDWQATWRNWCRRSMETRPNVTSNRPRYNPADASSPDAIAKQRAALASGFRAGIPGGPANHGEPSEDAA